MLWNMLFYNGGLDRRVRADWVSFLCEPGNRPSRVFSFSPGGGGRAWALFSMEGLSLSWLSLEHLGDLKQCLRQSGKTTGSIDCELRHVASSV